MRTEIALLQNVRVASPCDASWDQMTPINGDRVRFCDGCQKRVYNLSALGQAEAEGLLRAHEGHLCVRYYRRHDGTILTSDCPVGLRAARRLVLTRAQVSLGLCAILCVALAAHQSIESTSSGSPVEVESPGPQSLPTMGVIARPVPTHSVPRKPVPVTGRIRISHKPFTPREEIGDVTTAVGGNAEAVVGRLVPVLDPPAQNEPLLRY